MAFPSSAPHELARGLAFCSNNVKMKMGSVNVDTLILFGRGRGWGGGIRKESILDGQKEGLGKEPKRDVCTYRAKHDSTAMFSGCSDLFLIEWAESLCRLVVVGFPMFEVGKTSNWTLRGGCMRTATGRGWNRILQMGAGRGFW